MKKITKKLLFLCSASFAITTLTGCSDDEKWKFTIDDIPSFIMLDADINIVDSEGNMTFTVSEANQFFKNKSDFKDDDYIFFNYTELYSTSPKDEADFYSYKDFKDHKVDFSSLEITNDGRDLKIEFKGNPDNYYAFIANKNASNYDKFTACISSDYTENAGYVVPPEQIKFQNKYLAAPLPEYVPGTKQIDAVSYFGGLMSMNIDNNEENGSNFVPIWIPIAGFVFGVINFVGGVVNACLPRTTPSLTFMFETIRSSLNDISTKIDKLQSILLAELLNLKLQIEHDSLLSSINYITDYNTNYIFKLDNYRRQAADYISDTFPSYVSSPKSIKLFYTKVDDKYQPTSYHYVPTGDYVMIDIPSITFTNAKKAISETGVLAQNFADELKKDIQEAIKNIQLPDGVTQDACIDHAIANIEERLLESIYSSTALDKAREVRDLAINFCKTVGTYMSNIFNKYKLTFNFAGEARDAFRAAFSMINFELDRNVAFAQMLCRASKSDEYELSEVYKQAKEAAKNSYADTTKLANNYSFTFNKVITSKYVDFDCNRFFDNSGIGTCQMYISEYTHKEPYNKYFRDSVDLEQLQAFTSLNYDNMNIRTNSMKASGYVGDNFDLVKHLDELGAITKQAKSDYKLHNAQYKNDNYYLLPRDYTVTDLSNNNVDKSLDLKCLYQLNVTKGPYFTVGSTYKFMSGGYGDRYWTGKRYSNTVYDGKTGKGTYYKDWLLFASFYKPKQLFWSYPQSYIFGNANGLNNVGGYVLFPQA